MFDEAFATNGINTGFHDQSINYTANYGDKVENIPGIFEKILITW